jgi:hypothetical protein
MLVNDVDVRKMLVAQSLFLLLRSKLMKQYPLSPRPMTVLEYALLYTENTEKCLHSTLLR